MKYFLLLSTPLQLLRYSSWLSLILICLPGRGQTPVSLVDFLQTLNQKRGAYFLYDDSLIRNSKVNTPVNWRASTEAMLEAALAGTGLRYRKIEDAYLIEPGGLTNRLSLFTTTRKVTLSGFVSEKESGEQISGATVFVGKDATETNRYGYYSLTLPERDTIELVVSMVGYRRFYRKMPLTKSATLDIPLASNTMLNEVTLVDAGKDGAYSTTQTGRRRLPALQISQTPALLGEKDVLRTLQFVPGIQQGLNGQVGLHVRGGGADQNLFLLDEAPVYNANHLFGFFSAFNVDALHDVKLEKGGFSARYGGRLSSVVDMSMREGNRKQVRATAGTGVIASRVLVEGPMANGKASFLLTARHSNLSRMMGNFVASVVGDFSGTNWKANFYDLNAKTNLELNPRNKIYLSGYFGRNYFGGGDNLTPNLRWENVLTWQNQTANLRWNHLFSQKLFNNTSLIFSNYDFDTHRKDVSIEEPTKGVITNLWKHYNGITDLTFKSDFDFFPTSNHTVQAGVISIFRSFRLNGFRRETLSSLGNQADLQRTQSVETSVYAEDQWEISNRFKVNIGGRTTYYHHRDQSFLRAEPRVSAAYKWTDKQVFRASFSGMNQFIHLLSNTGLGLPTDLWVPATDLIKPQTAQQAVVGYVHDFTPRWQFTLEAYRKWMQHVISYREGADFVGITSAVRPDAIRWERNVTSGNGHASGIEASLQSRSGRLTGSMGYAWSITQWQFPELNGGKAFYPLHDRRHSFSVVGVYSLSPRLRVSAAWTYSSGNPFSVPVSGIPSFGHLGLGKSDIVVTPSERLFGTESPLVQARTSFSNFRAEANHRLDLTLQTDFKKGRFRHQLEIGAVNAYGRRNPFYYDLSLNRANELTLRRVSLFTFVPSLNYLIQY